MARGGATARIPRSDQEKGDREGGDRKGGVQGEWRRLLWFHSNTKIHKILETKCLISSDFLSICKFFFHARMYALGWTFASLSMLIFSTWKPSLTDPSVDVSVTL